MENKTNYTGREIIVSKFEIYPFEPSECEYSGFPKGVCQLEINMDSYTRSGFYSK